MKVRSLTTILEDESGSAIIVLIPNAVPVSCSVAQAERQFPEGAQVAIRHPYLRRFADKVLGILVEDPKDLIFLFIPEAGHGTDLNGDNGELHKYYSEDWQRQVGTVGKDHLSIPAGDQTFSGSDEDEQELKGGHNIRMAVDIKEYDAGAEKKITSGPDTPGDLVDSRTTAETVESLGRHGGSGAGDEQGHKPAADAAVGIGSKDVGAEEETKSELGITETGKNVPEVSRPHDEVKDGSVIGEAERPATVSNGDNVVDGNSFEIKRNVENGEFAGGENEDSIQPRSKELVRNGLPVHAGGVGREDGVHIEANGSTSSNKEAERAAKVDDVAGVPQSGGNDTHVSVVGSAKKVSETATSLEASQMVDGQKGTSQTGLNRTDSSAPREAENSTEVQGNSVVDQKQDVIVEENGPGTEAVVSGAEAPERAIQANGATPPERKELENGSQQTLSDTKLSVDSVISSSQETHQEPTQIIPQVYETSIHGDKEVTSNGGNLHLDRTLEQQGDAIEENGNQSVSSHAQLLDGTSETTEGGQRSTDGAVIVSGSPPREYDSGEDLFDYEFSKEGKICSADVTSAIAGKQVDDYQELTLGAQSAAGGEQLSTSQKDLQALGSLEEVGSSPRSHGVGTSVVEGTKAGSEQDDQRTSAAGLPEDSDTLSASDKSNLGIKQHDRALQFESTRDPLQSPANVETQEGTSRTTAASLAEQVEITEEQHAADTSPDGSATLSNSLEGRKETLTLLSIQINGEGESTSGEDNGRSSSPKKMEVTTSGEEGTVGAQVADTSQSRSSPVTSPHVSSNISAYALRVQGNRWFGQGDWKKAVSFYTWGIRQALKEHKSAVSAVKLDLQNGLSSKKKNTQAASSDAYPSGGKSEQDIIIHTRPSSEAGNYPDEESISVTTATVSPRTYTEILVGFSNRAEAWLRLQQYEKALIDSERALDLDGQHLKSIFRKGRALLGLGEYEEALRFLQVAKDRAPLDKDLQEALQACQVGDKQSRLGVYDLSEYILNGKTSGNSIVPRCADYVGPISVEHLGDDRGYGLRISRSVEAGSPILVSNPLVFVTDSSSNGDHLGSQQSGASILQEKLASVVLKQLDASTRYVERILALCHAHAGGEGPVESGTAIQNGHVSAEGPTLDVFNQAVKAYDSLYASAATKLSLQKNLDSARISRIIHHNAFDRSTLRTQVGSVEQDEDSDAWEEVSEAVDGADPDDLSKEETQGDEQICGIWSLPSFINHSCLPNTSWILVGRTLFVVASRDLAAGEEITFNYFDVLQPLAERRNASKSRWGFICTCSRCSLEEKVECHLQEVKNIYSSNQLKQSLREDPEAVAAVSSEVEKILSSTLQELSTVEKNWIRASFCRPYISHFEGSYIKDRKVTFSANLLEHLSSCVEALESVLPGSMDSMKMSVVARELAKRSHGKKSASYRLANAASLRICRCTYGKQKTNVLQALVTECRESLAKSYSLS